MVPRRWLLAALGSSVLILGGTYYLYATDASLSLPYLGAAILALVVGLGIGTATGAFEKRTYLIALVPFPSVLLIGIADLWSGDGAVASVVVGGGVGGLVVLALLRFS